VKTQSSRITVYTALFGDYEQLVEQPVRAQSSADFVCFTDNDALESETWQIRVVRPTMPWDTVRAARKIKILGHEIFESEVTLWIDNRVVLKATPETLVQTYLGENAMALPLHDHRASVRDEFAEVLAAGIDQPWRVREQLHYLEVSDRDVLHEVPYWTAILLRRRDDRVRRAMEIWADNVLCLSRRDQLSVNYAIKAAGLSVTAIVIDNTESPLHRWLRADVLPKKAEILYGRSFRYRSRDRVKDLILGAPNAIRMRNAVQRYWWKVAARFSRLK